MVNDEWNYMFRCQTDYDTTVLTAMPPIRMHTVYEKCLTTTDKAASIYRSRVQGPLITGEVDDTTPAP